MLTGAMTLMIWRKKLGTTKVARRTLASPSKSLPFANRDLRIDGSRRLLCTAPHGAGLHAPDVKYSIILSFVCCFSEVQFSHFSFFSHIVLKYFLMQNVMQCSCSGRLILRPWVSRF